VSKREDEEGEELDECGGGGDSSGMEDENGGWKRKRCYRITRDTENSNSTSPILAILSMNNYVTHHQVSDDPHDHLKRRNVPFHFTKLKLPSFETLPPPTRISHSFTSIPVVQTLHLPALP
jgi:hypothetical protein